MSLRNHRLPVPWAANISSILLQKNRIQKQILPQIELFLLFPFSDLISNFQQLAVYLFVQCNVELFFFLRHAGGLNRLNLPLKVSTLSH